MEISDPTSALFSGSSKRQSSGPDTNGTLQAAENSSPDPTKEPSLIERIRELGFAAYAEDIRQEKLEEMRREILRAMGLSEEDLAQMPPEQREAIEKMIAEEIARRLSAQSEADEKPKGLMPGIPATLIASDDGASGGLGVLLALQEAAAQRDQDPTPTRDDDNKS